MLADMNIKAAQHAPRTTAVFITTNDQQIRQIKT